MENKTNEKKELVVKFEGDKHTNGDYVKALAKYFIDYGIGGTWVLERANELVQQNQKKIEAYKQKVIAEVKL